MTPPHADPAILTESLDKRFWRRRGVGDILLHPLTPGKQVTALSEVSLSVRRGEIFGLLGPNGAGKTTLLKILCCLILPDNGRALVNGADTDTNEMAVKQAIGYVASDERSFYWRLTGAQNLTFFARLQGVAAGRIPALVASLLERMELTDKAGEPFSSFSSGMKQRLSIARALLHEPPILYLDEPTRSLDPVTARHIRELVRGLSAQQGKTVLLATHNLHEAEALCDRLAILSRSRIRRVGRLAEFRALFSAGRRYRLITDRQVDLSGVARLMTDDKASAGEDPGKPAGIHQVIEVDGGDDGDLSPLLARLASSGVRVLELTRQEDSLEDIFHQLLDDDSDSTESSA